MRTVVLGPPPPELTALMERRRQLGLDQYDEVWDGEYHMAPMAHFSHGQLQMQIARRIGLWADRAGLTLTGPFNLGTPRDYRIPDAGLHRGRLDAVWIPTAAMVVEIESPDDEAWEKLPFYAAREVDEVLIVTGERRSVTWLVRQGDRYIEARASRLLGPASESLPHLIDWPPAANSEPS